MKIKLALLIIIISTTSPVNTSLANNLELSGFIDSYFSNDFHRPKKLKRPYSTQAAREDEPAINLAAVALSKDSNSYRYNFAIQQGDSVDLNYSNENTDLIKYLNAASYGLKLSEKLWLDFGIYSSHLGFESFMSKDNWNYTRSLVAENLPYYESGLKLSYQASKKDSFEFHLLRGWQNIFNPTDPALGFKYQRNITKNLDFSYGNFIGDVSGLRVFNDFILTYKANSKLQFALEFDFGRQEQDKVNSKYWLGSSLMTNYSINQNLSVNFRLENFYDPKQTVVSTLNSKSFNVFAYSCNLDYQLRKGLFWRNEVKSITGKEAVFPTSSGYSNNDLLLVTALVYDFSVGL